MQLIKEALDTILFGEEEDCLLRAFLSEGHPDSRLAIVTGDNASGKSFLVNLLATFCVTDKRFKAEPLQVSMKYRTESGMHRAFMYGAFGDSMDSTGSNSMIGVQGLLRTARERKKPHWALLDEPDVGLSDSYSRAMGTWLAEECQTLGKSTVGTVIVTHSKALVSSLFASSSLRPWFVHMGSAATVESWLEDRSEKSVADLLSLSERSYDLHRDINARLALAKDVARAVERK